MRKLGSSRSKSSSKPPGAEVRRRLTKGERALFKLIDERGPSDPNVVSGEGVDIVERIRSGEPDPP